MKKYERPQIDIVILETEDIISESGIQFPEVP